MKTTHFEKGPGIVVKASVVVLIVRNVCLEKQVKKEALDHCSLAHIELNSGSKLNLFTAVRTGSAADCGHARGIATDETSIQNDDWNFRKLGWDLDPVAQFQRRSSSAISTLILTMGARKPVI